MIPKNYIIYPNPIIKQVIFQIKFANLFIIENKIGEFQEKIIDKFPESSLSIRRQVMIADVGPEFKLEEISTEESLGVKIWQFKSDDKYTLSVLTNSLDIVSQQHKSYYSPDSNGFRDITKYSVDYFLELVPLHTIKRMGLRYIDDAPIPSMKNEEFKEWYNTVFPLNRFDLENTEKIQFLTTTRRKDYFLTYRESIVKEESTFKYYLDFDGYATNVHVNNYISILDELHELIHNEWENTIKDPVKKFMSEKNE